MSAALALVESVAADPFGPSGIRDAKTARKLLGILEDHRWIVRIQGGMRLDDAHRKDAWRIVGKEAKP